MTLAARRADPKYSEWCRRVRRADPELEPTAAWLEAA
jgi:hypothetical protein